MGAMTVTDRVGRIRVDRLTQRIQRIRVGLSVDVARLCTTMGMSLMPLGLVLICVGWYGAAHSQYATQSISYLISGGLTGLACVIAGSALFFGASLIRQERRLERALTVLEYAVEIPSHQLTDRSTQ